MLQLMGDGNATLWFKGNEKSQFYVKGVVIPEKAMLLTTLKTK